MLGRDYLTDFHTHTSDLNALVEIDAVNRGFSRGNPALAVVVHDKSQSLGILSVCSIQHFVCK